MVTAVLADGCTSIMMKLGHGQWPSIVEETENAILHSPITDVLYAVL
jgi:hypothetical protein